MKREKLIKILKREKNVAILFLLLATVLVCIPLFQKKLDMTYDDGIQHICRVMGTYQSIEEGQKFPVIMSSFCNNFGYSWNLFYSPFTAYAPLIFKILGLSFTNCIKVFMFLVTFFSGFFMYKFVRKVSKNQKVAILAGILYIFAPYRLTDMYIRNALAELASFTFIPLVFLGLYNILNTKKKKGYLLAIGTVGLLLTHTVLTMYTAIFAVMYVIVSYKRLKQKNVLKMLVVNTILALAITTFFWFPMLEQKNAADYEVFKPGRMERTEVLIAFKLDFSELFYTPKENGMIFSLDILTMIGLAVTPIVIQKLRKEKKYVRPAFWKMYIFSLIAGLISLIMTLKIFPFEYLPSICKMLQFSFRMLTFSTFFLSFIVAVNFGILLKEIKIKHMMIALGILVITTSFYTSHLNYLENFDEKVLWPSVSVTENTGRVHAGCASFEYLPSKAFENREYIEERDDKVHVLTENITIIEENKEGATLDFAVAEGQAETILELPFIYYKGYVATLEKEEIKQEIETFETDKGFVGIKLPEVAQGKIRISYKGTNAMAITTAISLTACLVLIYVYLQNIVKKKLKNKNY